MTITALPDPPDPTDSTAVFNAKAFALLGALPTFVTEANAQAVEVNDDATAAATAKTNAETAEANAEAAAAAAALSASAAATSASAALWVSGTTYAIGDQVRSPATLLIYIRKTNGAGTTDPASDGTNWRPYYAIPELVTAESLFLANL